MAEVKLVLAHPRPCEVDDFERAYLNEHLAMTRARIAEIYFPSIEALQACAATERRRPLAHAISISNGGPPYVQDC
jgi:hypothetical protein